MMERNKSFHILVADDEEEYQTVFSMILSEHGYDVVTCANGEDALRILCSQEINLIMTDLKMPGMSGLELIQRAKEYDRDVEIMVITAFGSIESAVQAMKFGANGYFVKSSDPPETLLADVARIAKIKRLQTSNEILRQQRPSPQIFLNTKNKQFEEILDNCEKAASTGINILLLGESGVGKEVIANYIHSKSERSDNHLIAVNCQVFSDGTIESELFGHEKGSFTGAVGKRIGRFEEANFGTLFLDEIGDLPIPTQGKLLRTLERRAIERVGSNKSIDLNIRLISATNKDLNEEIRQGRFREDLLYRINALTITIPPLRERKEDLPGLIDFFLQGIERDQKKKITRIDDEVTRFLLNYDYPGNVRELKNILERLAALSEGGRLRAKDIQFQLVVHPQNVCSDAPLSEVPLRDARAKFESSYIQNILDHHNGSAAESAQVLGITRRQLWNKISEYGLKTTPRR